MCELVVGVLGWLVLQNSTTFYNNIVLMFYQGFINHPLLYFSHSDSFTSEARWTNLLPVDMTEFWLISAPGEKTCQQTWDKLMVATTRTNNLSTNNKFNIPDLKVKHDSINIQQPLKYSSSNAAR